MNNLGKSSGVLAGKECDEALERRGGSSGLPKKGRTPIIPAIARQQNRFDYKVSACSFFFVRAPPRAWHKSFAVSGTAQSFPTDPTDCGLFISFRHVVQVDSVEQAFTCVGAFRRACQCEG